MMDMWISGYGFGVVIWYNLLYESMHNPYCVFAMRKIPYLFFLVKWFYKKKLEKQRYYVVTIITTITTITNSNP
jgi:hypothetical protein